jgi:hypothetical protein
MSDTTFWMASRVLNANPETPETMERSKICDICPAATRAPPTAARRRPTAGRTRAPVAPECECDSQRWRANGRPHNRFGVGPRLPAPRLGAIGRGRFRGGFACGWCVEK